MWHTDDRGAVDYVNARFCTVTGIARQRALGDRWTMALHPSDLARADRHWRSAAARGAEFEDEFRLRTQDGSYRRYVLRAAPHRDLDATVLGWLVTCFDIENRKRTEEALVLLLDAGTQLLSSLGLREAYESLCRVLVPAQASWVAIATVDGRARASIVAIRHCEAGYHAEAQKLVAASFDRRERFGGPIERGVPELIPMLPGDWQASLAPRLQDFFERFETVSTLGIPIRLGHRVHAVLTLGRGPGRAPFGHSDVPVFMELGRRTSLATDNAARYDGERRVATSFQHAALPAALPHPPGVSFDAVYQAGNSEALVGGDWYDAFVLDDGRIVVSIGDVAGSGLGAAVTMGLVRQSMRAAARVLSEPLAILDAADRTLRADEPERFVTAFVAIFDPHTNAFSYAGAGHPPPLLRRPDGEIAELAATSLPLGLRRPAAAAGADTVMLEPGSIVVLHTDGLTEATRDVLEGERRLRAAVAQPALLAAAEPAHFIWRAVLQNPARDDVAILTMRIAPAP